MVASHRIKPRQREGVIHPSLGRLFSLSKTFERAKYAALHRWNQGDGPEAEQARRNLAALGLEEHVLKVLAAAPRPSDEQLERIASILLSGGIRQHIDDQPRLVDDQPLRD